jgi:benzylsuccinate CoA-transferase BbsF subunit
VAVSDDNPGPLTGLRVTSFGNFVAGNSFAMLLAELGADVVKVESHARPDPVRARFNSDHPETLEPSGAETTTLFAGLSRSVRDLSIDMKAPGAKDLFRRVVLATDVLFENFGAGVLAGWGMDWPALSAINPGLVMVSVSGYGRTGPRAGYLAYGGNISSFVGLTHLWGQSHGTMYDYVAGAHAAVTALAALRVRDETGQGCHIDLGQVEAAGAVLATQLLDQLNGGPAAEPPGNRSPGAWFSAVVPSRGTDCWVAVEAETRAEWQRLADLVGLARTADPNPPDDAAVAAVTDALAAWARSRTAWQAASDLQAAGVPSAPVQSNEDVWRDPQLRARGSIVPVTHPDLGTYEYPAPVHRMTLTPARVRRHAPRLGQDTRYVLTHWLGMDEASVLALVESGVVGTDDPAPNPPQQTVAR